MLKNITPEQAGLEEKYVTAFVREMQENGINFHSMLMLRGNEIFFEKYWAPFDANTPHRMYSITKSFVAIAIGCLIDEGKLRLEDKIVDFFPDKLPETVHPFLKEQTIRDMLTMQTCFVDDGSPRTRWFQKGVTDRTAFYFSQPVVKPTGTIFDYDSNGSYIMGALVERLSGMSLLDYLKEKILNKIGDFENSQMLQTPDGTAWGDSAMICTPRALLNFARFVMNYGTWDGQRLLSEEFLRDATSDLVDTDVTDWVKYDHTGYGYQIWRHPRGFSFNGMLGQFAICVPEKDFILVCTMDGSFGTGYTSPLLFRCVETYLVNHFDGGSPETPFIEETAIRVANGEKDHPMAKKISGKTFVLEENPMGIKWLRVDLDGDEGKLTYENAQGEKELPFGMKKNVFAPFPQAGYSNDRGNVHEINDFRYRCAASAAWCKPRKLKIKVQIVDRYFGDLVINLGFRDENTLGVAMYKVAEDFLSEYIGWAIGNAKE